VNSEFVGRVGLVRLVGLVGAVRSSVVNFELGTSCKLAPAGAKKQEMFSRDNKQRHKNIEDIEDE